MGCSTQREIYSANAYFENNLNFYLRKPQKEEKTKPKAGRG